MGTTELLKCEPVMVCVKLPLRTKVWRSWMQYCRVHCVAQGLETPDPVNKVVVLRFWASVPMKFNLIIVEYGMSPSVEGI